MRSKGRNFMGIDDEIRKARKSEGGREKEKPGKSKEKKGHGNRG